MHSVCVNELAYLFMCVYVFRCVFECVHLCVYVYVYVCVCMCVARTSG